jgi:ribonuclease BN (tRNA processing enzyme)
VKLRVLGAHNLETASTRLACLLIDDILALDAGAITSTLTLEEQIRIRAVLVSHRHFDHVRDLATLALNTFYQTTTDVYAPAGVIEALRTHILNGILYSKMDELPTPEKPSLRYHPLEAGQQTQVAGYDVSAFAMNHSAPTAGFYVRDDDGKSIFYGSDTGPGNASTWEQLDPDLLIIETTLPNSQQALAEESLHLTPSLLREELLLFRKVHNTIPRVLIVHQSPYYEAEIAKEVELMAKDIDADITMGQEGMIIDI